MFAQGKIFVQSEESIIRMMIDVSNLIKDQDMRINNMEYEFFEALIHTQRSLGSINSAAAETNVKELLNKPAMSRRSFKNYINDLVLKGWLIEENRNYYRLPAEFDLHKKRFKEGGVLCTLSVERLNEVDREDTQS